MAIGGHGALIAGEGAHQHDQRGLRQVKIGDQQIHLPKTVAWRDEDVRLPLHRLQSPITAGAFKTAHRCGAHRHHAPASRTGRLHLRHQFRRDFDPFAVHAMLADVLHLHRLEGARPHMQGDKARLHAPLAQLRQQRLIKMQSRRGCGHRAFPAGIDGLIARLIKCFVRPLDIGGQWHMPVTGHGRFPVSRIQPQTEQIFLPPQHGDGHLAFDQQLRSRLGAAAGAHMGQRLPLAQHPLHQHFYPAARRLAPIKTRRHDTGIIEYQQVARLKIVADIAKHAVFQPLWPHHQQTAGGSFRHRALGDEPLRQFKIKVLALE